MPYGSPHDLSIQKKISRYYIAVAIAGAATPAQRERLLTAGASLVRDQGAEVVLLGGTDLNLVYDGVALDFLVIDCASVLVDAIVHAT